MNSENINETNKSSKDEQMNSENINETNKSSKENKINEKPIEIEKKYKFGWGSYSEITNGRFAMIGFLAIIIIELFSKVSFLQWIGIN